MNLYKTTGEKEDGAVTTLWSGTLADAGKDRAMLKKTNNKGVGTEDVDVPTNKPGLIAWLNDNAK